MFPHQPFKSFAAHPISAFRSRAYAYDRGLCVSSFSSLETGLRIGLTCYFPLRMLPAIPDSSTSGFPIPGPSPIRDSQTFFCLFFTPSPRPWVEKSKEKGGRKDLTSSSKLPRSFGKRKRPVTLAGQSASYPFTLQLNHDMALPHSHLLKLGFLKSLVT